MDRNYAIIGGTDEQRAGIINQLRGTTYFVLGNANRWVRQHVLAPEEASDPAELYRTIINQQIEWEQDPHVQHRPTLMDESYLDKLAESEAVCGKPPEHAQFTPSYDAVFVLPSYVDETLERSLQKYRDHGATEIWLPCAHIAQQKQQIMSVDAGESLYKSAAKQPAMSGFPGSCSAHRLAAAYMPE